MQGITLREFVRIARPSYQYVRLTPNYSVRNYATYKLARTINSLYRNILQSIKKEQAQVIKFLGREFLMGTRYSITITPKVAYYIYMEKRRIEFYLIVPEQYFSVIKEKIGDTWTNITVTEVDKENVPQFTAQATKYQLCYAKEDGLSLAVDRRTNELLESNLNVVDVLEEGDKVGVFYNFIPSAQFGWRSSYQATIDKIRKNIPVDRNKVNLSYLLRMALSIVSDLLNDITGAFAGNGHLLKPDNPITSLERALTGVTSARAISDATFQKATDTIINTQILTLSESENRIRQYNNVKSVAQSFDSISEDNRLVAKPYRGKFNPLTVKINGVEVNKISSRECSNFLALPGRELLERYNFIEKVQTQETQVPEDLRQGIMCLGENTFKGNKQLAYLSNDFDYRMLSLVLIGPNRAGKSKFLANIARDAISAGECVVIPDFIGSCQLSQEIASVFPPEKVLEIKCDDYETMQGLGYNEVPPSDNPFIQYKNAKEQTALLMTFIDSINAEEANFTAKMGRYMEAAALTVFLSGGNINDVFNVLLNHKRRREYIKRIPEAQRENMQEYLDYLQELDNYEKGQVVGTKTHLIMGAIDRLHRLKVNAYLEMMLKKGIRGNVDLVKEIQKSQLIVIKMPQRMFLTDNEKDVYTTYWLTKLWLALQIREEQIGDRKKMTKVNLIIDELYQVNNAEKFLMRKLSQLPKFNLKPIISCHYLNQIRIIREELRSANASYMLISGCDKKNYGELASELYPYTEEDLLGLPRYHSLNLIKCNEGYGKFITKLPKPISN
jgi:hypothetical protein